MPTESSSAQWPSRLEWGLIVAFWGTFALLSLGQGVFGDGDSSAQWGQIIGEFVEYGGWALLTPLVFWFAKTLPVVESLPEERRTALRNIGIHAALALLLAISIDLSEDVVTLAAGMDMRGEWSLLRPIRGFWFMDELVIYLVVLMAGFARSYYFEKKARQKEAERLEERAQVLETQLTEARLEALRMQLNPHFLFNTLHAVSTLVDRDPVGVRRMITRLSELLRRVLDEEAPQEVPLSRELDFLNDYLEIQTIRFRGRLEVDIDVPASLQDAQVPNLILQPLAENAIKHGASQVRGEGRLLIRARRKEAMLIVEVWDNGPGPGDNPSDGFGLRNVRARLEALYGENQTLTLTEADTGGTVARLKLPFHTSTDLYTTVEASAPSSMVGDGVPD